MRVRANTRGSTPGGRLQGPQPAAPLPLRQGEDARAARHRPFPQAPAPAVGRRQAGREIALLPYVGEVDRGPMAQAILLEDVKDLGERGDPDRRLPGLPSQLPSPAQVGGAGNAGRPRGGECAGRLLSRRPSFSGRNAKGEAAALLSKTVLTIHQRAGDDGKLFGSVGPRRSSRRSARRARPAHR